MVVLGISPGTSTTGVAVLHDDELIKWQTLPFPGKWSKKKLITIIQTVKEWVATHHVNHVVVKIPDELPISKGYIQLLGAINVLCENGSIKPQYYTLNELKQYYSPTCKINKQTLIELVVQLFPDLNTHYLKEMKSKKSYYLKIFEAVAAAKCYTRNHMPI